MPINVPLWKLKLPLKVKIFLWLLHRGVILTKDNLAKRNWHRSKQCCYYSNNETLKHLFFDCHIARLIWRIIHTTFNLQKPDNISHMFGSWLQGVGWRQKNLILTSISAVCWAIWLNRNDVIFYEVYKQNCLQILFRTTHCIRFLALLQKEEDRDTISEAC